MREAIYVIGYRASSSGIGSYTIELSRALAMAGHDVVLLSYGLDLGSIRSLELSGVFAINLGPDPGWRIDVGGPYIAYNILSGRIPREILESQYVIFTIPGFAVRAKSPRIVVAWGHLGFWESISAGIKWLPLSLKPAALPNTLGYWALDSSIYRRATVIVTLTRASKAFFNMRFPSKVVYVPPPVEVNSCVEERFSGDRLTIVFIARDLGIPRKNFVTLLKALKILDKDLSYITLKLIGGGGKKYLGHLEALKKYDLKIELLGKLSRDKTLAELCRSDVLVYPSFYEELGYAILEAMASGLAVIASNIPPFNEYIEHGVNGYLIDPRSPRELARALEMLSRSRDLLERMKRSSIKIVRERFNPYSVASVFVKILYR